MVEAHCCCVRDKGTTNNAITEMNGWLLRLIGEYLVRNWK